MNDRRNAGCNKMAKRRSRAEAAYLGAKSRNVQKELFFCFLSVLSTKLDVGSQANHSIQSKRQEVGSVKQREAQRKCRH